MDKSIFEDTKKGDKCWYIPSSYNNRESPRNLIVTKKTENHIHTIEHWSDSRQINRKFRFNDGYEEVKTGSGGKLFPSRAFYDNIIEAISLREEIILKVKSLNTIQLIKVLRYIDSDSIK
jgi:hypothetical protein